jgi:hypothetical protein
MRRRRWLAGAAFVGLLSASFVARAQGDTGEGRPGVEMGPDQMPPPGATLAPSPRNPIGGQAEGRRYQLQSTPEGGYAYVGPRFAARIAPDGSVAFSGRDVQIVPQGDVQTIGRDAVTAEDPISSRIPIAVEARPGVRFDATDEYLRLLGKDPAKGEKAAFLAATFDLRAKMAAHAQRALVREALAELPARLEQIWQDPRLSPAERRHLLLATWGDLDRGPEGDAARSVIRGFARSHLPSEEAAVFE